jgi:hypothetical protein
MDAVQRLRTKAVQSGKLKSSPQEKITTTTQSGQPTIEIEPADPDVVYVPEYNPVWIWGSPVGYYYPAWYYPPPPPFGVWFFWGAAFSMSFYYPGWIGYGGWGGWGYRAGWHEHSFYRGRDHAAWSHNPAHRMGVAYSNHSVARHFNAPERVGNRFVMPNSATRNRSAFGGTQHGSNARVYGSRGRSSLAHGATGGLNRSSGSRGGGPGGGHSGGHGGGGKR